MNTNMITDKRRMVQQKHKLLYFFPHFVDTLIDNASSMNTGQNENVSYVS